MNVKLLILLMINSRKEMSLNAVEAVFFSLDECSSVHCEWEQSIFGVGGCVLYDESALQDCIAV